MTCTFWLEARYSIYANNLATVSTAAARDGFFNNGSICESRNLGRKWCRSLQ